jgi:glycosyltransferase involved in cell wall biosynthesis
MIRSRLQLNDDRIIACVGRVTPRKGQLTLLRALAAKGLDRPGLSVVIAGQYSARDIGFASELRAESAKLQHIRTVFADDLTDEEVRSLYAAADVFCLPGSGQTSAVEGFGLVYLEAAAQGTPSVAGAARGVPEVISHGETGLLVAADEPMELAVALTTLLDDPAKRLLMGEAARLRAGKFTWRRCAETVFGSR